MIVRGMRMPKPRSRMPRINAASFVAILKAEGIPAPETEYRFHPKRLWRLDYAWPAQKLALEIEGGIYGHGRQCLMCGRRKVAGHTSIQRLETDMEKYNAVNLDGWTLLRFTPEAFQNGTALRVIRDFLESKSDGTLRSHHVSIP